MHIGRYMYSLKCIDINWVGVRKKESVEGMHANVFLHRRWSKKGREREFT
jgi:hypothetical protein